MKQQICIRYTNQLFNYSVIQLIFFLIFAHEKQLAGLSLEPKG